MAQAQIQLDVQLIGKISSRLVSVRQPLLQEGLMHLQETAQLPAWQY